MRTKWVAPALVLAAFALGAAIGCGNDPADQTDLAKLPPPSQQEIDRAKAIPQPKSKLKFGAPPRSEIQRNLRSSP